MVVVLPTPFTPTTSTTYGLRPAGILKGSESSSGLFSTSRFDISSRKMPFNSAVPMYLSRATRSWMRLIILRVVSTPTSDIISTSSRLSSTSSSTTVFPATARAILESTLVLVFSRPLSSTSFLSFVKNENNPIKTMIKTAKIKTVFTAKIYK